MPKKFKKYADFSGGINSACDPRHINDNELSDMSNFASDSTGKIRTMGSLGSTPQSSSSATPYIATADVRPIAGYGLFVFGSDYDMPTGTPTYGRNNYIAAGVFADSEGQNITIYGDHTQGSGTTKSWSDRVVIAPTIVSNGGMETSDPPTSWSAYSANTTISRSNTQAHSGTYSIKCLNSYAGANANTGTYQSITSVLETTYLVSAWVHGGGSMTGRTVSLIVYDAVNGDVTVDTGTLTDAWQQLSGTTTYGATSCQVQVRASALSQNQFYYADDVSVSILSKPVFYYVDNALRVCDANFGANNNFMWFGYVKNTHWDNATGEENWDGWYSIVDSLTAPTEGVVSKGIYGTGEATSNATTIVNSALQDWTSILGASQNYAVLHENGDPGAMNAVEITGVSSSPPYSLTTDTVNPNTWLASKYLIVPPAGLGFCVYALPAGSGGSWTAQTLEFASTFIYIDNQESLLFKNAGTVTVVDNDSISILVAATKSYNRKIIGGRIYYRTQYTNDPWKLFVDINMTQGCRTSLNSNWSAWSNCGAYTSTSDGVTSSTFFCTTSTSLLSIVASDLITSDVPNLDTYESLTGLPQDTITLAIKAKCFEVGNNRAWAGSVKTTDAASNTLYYGDRIMYTPPGKHDTWPPTYYLDIATGDGDEIKALQIYADRLLVFKEFKLYIINISHGSDTNWFVESQHANLGVKIPGAAFKCDIGIIWVNKNGCYLYDGEKISNLLDKVSNGILNRIINISDWGTFVTNNALIGYDPKKRQIVILGDANDTEHIYIYDMLTGSWTKGDRFNQASGFYTNFATYENDLIIGSYTT